jgi:hypothetical protein
LFSIPFAYYLHLPVYEVQKYNKVKLPLVMPHFTDDLFTSGKAGIVEGLEIHHEGVSFFIDGEHTTLDTEFAALEGVIPDDIQGKGTMQGFQHNEEAESIDP